jgi:hypothetical protein
MRRRNSIDAYHRLLLSLAKNSGKVVKDDYFNRLMDIVREGANQEMKIKLYAYLKDVRSK